MGIYFNPGNESFTKDKNSELYVDKTRLLEYLNRVVGTNANCISVSHARCFGKSHAAGMIDAYYSRGCDSSELFKDTEIAKNSDFKKYLNQYNVIHLDISSFWDSYKDNIVEKIQEYIYKDFRIVFGDELDYRDTLSYVLMSVYQKTKIPFVIIIDEWDCIIRNSGNEDLVHNYLQFLDSLFKGEESKAFLALAYITGILPIKKIKDESALNNFREFTMLKSKPITQYYGFTEEEVKALCEKYDMDFDAIKAWYNGYLIDGMHMYNPNSVVQSMLNQDYDSYLSVALSEVSYELSASHTGALNEVVHEFSASCGRNTSSFESINTFITMISLHLPITIS